MCIYFVKKINKKQWICNNPKFGKKEILVIRSAETCKCKYYKSKK